MHFLEQFNILKHEFIPIADSLLKKLEGEGLSISVQAELGETSAFLSSFDGIIIFICWLTRNSDY